VEFPDPIAICEGEVNFSGLTFPLPGEYRLQLVSAGELIIERRLLVMSVQNQEEQTHE